MHILFLTDNFPPEGNAPASRTFEHAREWVKRGHSVTVITCAPNFPEGKVFNGYKNKWLLREKIEGIKVWRVKTYISANEGFFRRAIDFLSFMITSFFFGLFTRNVDLVIGTSPQFFTVVSAWALAKLKRVPFVFELRDIWPASITAVGAMGNTWIISVLESLEMFFYRQAELIITVTNSFKAELESRGVSADKIKVVLNGVDTSLYKPLAKKDEDFSRKYELDNKFVAGYVGTHGMAHALDSILDAAELMKSDDSIRIIFAGGGADRSRIENLIRVRGLQNIVMIPRQPKTNMRKVWSLCDISLVSLKNTPLFSKVIPSKIFESMAMKLPIVIMVPTGEATQIIQLEKIGLTVPPENPSKLADAILRIKNNENLFDGFAENSLKSAYKFDRKSLAVKMLNHLEDQLF